MDGIFWLNKLQSAEYARILAELVPNRLSKAEFEQKLIQKYGEITHLNDDCLTFNYNDELIQVQYCLDGSLTVLAHSKEKDFWYIPEIKWEIVLMYGVSADDMQNNDRSIAFFMYKLALAEKISRK